MTKAKQHNFYKQLLAYIKTTPHFIEHGFPIYGLCSEMYDLSRLNNKSWSYSLGWVECPILYSLKPVEEYDTSGMWFPYNLEGWKCRENLLIEAIMLSAPKKRKI